MPDQGTDTPNPAGPPGRSILFVCTGNTCRSPLAEALCKRLLADRLGCDPTNLPARGFVVRSAGVAAVPGDEVSPQAVEAARDFGADLGGHRGTRVTPELLAAATDVVAMTRAHAVTLAAWFPGVGPDPVLLCGDGDLEDPIGGDLDLYRACARAIADHLGWAIDGWCGGAERGETTGGLTGP